MSWVFFGGRLVSLFLCASVMCSEGSSDRTILCPNLFFLSTWLVLRIDSSCLLVLLIFSTKEEYSCKICVNSRFSNFFRMMENRQINQFFQILSSVSFCCTRRCNWCTNLMFTQTGRWWVNRRWWTVGCWTVLRSRSSPPRVASISLLFPSNDEFFDSILALVSLWSFPSV